MNQPIRCYGCGAILQTDDQKKVGYIPQIKDNGKPLLCQRCFRLQHYHKLEKTSLQSDDFLKILQQISEKPGLIVYIIDLFDFNGSMLQGLTRHLPGKDILVVANKRDLLPKLCNNTKITHWIYRHLKEYGIKPSRLHIDPLVEMLCTSEDGISMIVEVMNTIREEYPTIHITGAVSNISFNLPARKLVNQGFVVLAMNAGLDSAILDPLNRDMMGMIYATEALLGQDDYCMEYISAYREGLIGPVKQQ